MGFSPGTPWLLPSRLPSLAAYLQPRYAWMAVGILLVIWLLLYLWRSHVRPAAPTARSTQTWATKREAAQEGVFNDTGMYLGEAFGRYLRAPSERNVAVFGPPGKGKTVTNMLTTLTDCDEADVFCVDSSGDLIRKTADHRRTLGPVYILDLNDLNSPDQTNLLDLVRWDTPYAFDDCQRQSNHIVKPRGSISSSGAEHYERVATAIIPLSMMLTHYSTRFAHSYEGLLDFFSTPGFSIQDAITLMSQSPFQTLRRGAARLHNQDARVLKADWAAAAEWLTLWESQVLARNTNGTTIPWEQLEQGPSPMTVYFKVSPSDARGRLRPVIRLMLDQVLFLITNRASMDYVRELLMLFEDADNLGPLPILAEIGTDKRKYGLRLMLLYQSPAQLRIGIDYHGPLLNSCGCWVVYGQYEPDDAAYLSRKFAETTVLEPMDRISHRSGQLSRTLSRGVQTRTVALMPAGELLSLDRDQILICVEGKKIKARRINAERRAPFKGRLAV
jgi:type IV secretory pathway TraG/TraD family ATPase VirD4